MYFNIFCISKFNYTSELDEKNPKTVESAIESKFQNLVFKLPFDEKKKKEEKFDKNRKPEINLEPRRLSKSTKIFYTKSGKKDKEKVIPAQPVLTFVVTYKCITLNVVTEVYDGNGRFF